MLESQIMILLKLQLFVPSLAALPRGTVAFAAAAAADDAVAAAGVAVAVSAVIG